MSFRELVEVQREYFLTGKPAKLSHRREQLLKLRKVISDGKDMLAAAVNADLRRHKDTTYIVETVHFLTEIDYLLENLEEWSSPQTVSRTFCTMLDTPEVIKEPKGVVLVLSPWNFPLFTLFLPLIGALAAGNCAIVKPSEVAPHTAKAVDELLSKNFEPYYLAVVSGGVDKSMELLQERFDHIVFTGSSMIAPTILKAAAEHLTPCTLELGGKSPVIVEPDTDIEITAKRLVWGKWLNAGQICVAPDYLLVNAGVKQKLLNEIERNIHQFFGKDIQKSADYSRIINVRHFDRLVSLLEQTNGRQLFDGGVVDKDDLFIPPMIFEVTPDDVLMEEEIFGPILPIIEIEKLDDAISFIKRGEKPLVIYAFTRNEFKAERIIKETQSGSVCLNDSVIQLAVNTLPFGGVGKSGMGRYRGKFGFDEFSHTKGVLKRGFFADGIAPRYPPSSDAKFARLRQLLETRLPIPRWLPKIISAIPILLLGALAGFAGGRYFDKQPLF